MDIRVISGPGSFDQLGSLATELGFTRALVISDKGIVAAGFADRATTSLRENGILAWIFDDVDAGRGAHSVEAGRACAIERRVNGLVAVGGGSSLDCAKGINVLLTLGGSLRDYHGRTNDAGRTTLPSIGIPTTAGSGSEAQSLAIGTAAGRDAAEAGGDDSASFRAVILDPELTVSQPRDVTAIAGYDAIAHAVEAYVTRTRTPESQAAAKQAWGLLEANYERVLHEPGDLAARAAMLLGANRAGAAIELSMLGAADACAASLTAKYGTTHGLAIAVMLPHVVRWNAEVVGDEYGRLWDGDLASRLDELGRAAPLPRTLAELGASRDDFDALAAAAASQRAGMHNPRAFDARAARELYERAL